MADILPADLATHTSAELLDACGQLQEAYTAALDREAKERETAAARLRDGAGRLAALLGPENPPAGDLSSLRAACRLTPEELGERQAEAMELVLRSPCAVVAVAQQAVLIGAEQAH